jgi:hypothetical protein
LEQSGLARCRPDAARSFPWIFDECAASEPKRKRFPVETGLPLGALGSLAVQPSIWNGVCTMKKFVFIATAVALLGWMLLATANVSGAIAGVYDEKKTEEKDKCCVANEEEKKEEKDKLTVDADEEKKEDKDKLTVVANDEEKKEEKDK